MDGRLSSFFGEKTCLSLQISSVILTEDQPSKNYVVKWQTRKKYRQKSSSSPVDPQNLPGFSVGPPQAGLAHIPFQTVQC